MFPNLHLVTMMAIAMAAVDFVLLAWLRPMGYAPFGSAREIPVTVLLIPQAVVAAQVSLLATWLCFGPPPVVQQVVLSAIGIVALHIAFLSYALHTLDLAYGITGVLLLIGVGQRWLTSPQSSIAQGRIKFALLDLLCLITALACAFAFLRTVRSGYSLHWPSTYPLMISLATIVTMLSTRVVAWRVIMVLGLLMLTIGYCLGPGFHKGAWLSILRLVMQIAVLLPALIVVHMAGVRLKFWTASTETQIDPQWPVPSPEQA